MWNTVINNQLYKRGFSSPLLKCLTKEEGDYVLAELHEGIYGNHVRGRSLAKRALRAEYLWLTLENDMTSYVKKRDAC